MSLSRISSAVIILVATSLALGCAPSSHTGRERSKPPRVSAGHSSQPDWRGAVVIHNPNTLPFTVTVDSHPPIKLPAGETWRLEPLPPGKHHFKIEAGTLSKDEVVDLAPAAVAHLAPLLSGGMLHIINPNPTPLLIELDDVVCGAVQGGGEAAFGDLSPGAYTLIARLPGGAPIFERRIYFETGEMTRLALPKRADAAHPRSPSPSHRRAPATTAGGRCAPQPTPPREQIAVGAEIHDHKSTTLQIQNHNRRTVRVVLWRDRERDSRTLGMVGPGAAMEFHGLGTGALILRAVVLAEDGDEVVSELRLHADPGAVIAWEIPPD